MSKVAKVTKLKPHRAPSKAEISGMDRYSILFNEAQDAIMVVDLKSGTITEANRAMQDLTGFVAAELEGASASVLGPNSAQSTGRTTWFSTNVLTMGGLHEDLAILGKDGLPIYVSLSVRVIHVEGHDVALCILRNVGEKKKLERELITKHNELRSAYGRLEKANEELKVMQETLVQSGKLAALGELAAGIAHELNQPLTIIRGFSQEAQVILKSMLANAALQPQIEGDARALGDYLKEIEKGADKMDRIISHMRGFTRKSTEDYRWVQVHEVIEEALKMLEQQFKSRGIQVVRQFEKDLPPIYANPFQLEQVFINFATNARDAIEEKRNKEKQAIPSASMRTVGQLVIRTERVTSVGTKSGTGAVEMVQVRIEDNGVGIPDGVKSKIFNPFFTTKEVGKGMGLGLSITYGILSKINASVFVESEPGKGTVFTVRIPVDYRAL
jgi:histidine kinase